MISERELERVLREKESYLVECLSELVSIPTFVPPGEKYGEIVDALVPKFERLGFDARRVDMPVEIYEERQKQEGLSGERANLLAEKDCGAKEGITIYTHLDVVPAGEGWDTPPFQAVVKNGRIYGRGTADSKGAVAALLTALSIIQELGLECKYNLCVALTTDEEIGPYSGLCYFADEGLLRGDYFLCMDGENENICIAANGVFTWEITVFGQSCHSSLPMLGENAIEIALKVIERLRALKERVEARTSAVKCVPSIAKMTNCAFIKPVLNITMIEGGVKENIIPGSCTLRGDRRYIPEEDLSDAEAEFIAVLEDLRKEGINLAWKIKRGYPPMLTAQDSEWVLRVKRAASAAFGCEKEVGGVQGSLDVGYAVQRTKQPVCAFGVGDSVESNAHGPNENVRLADLRNYVKFLVFLLTGAAPHDASTAD
ncbi:MAG: ArgE/DapE family deacylase [Candidatus Methanospirare jalkutatii]|nr:MAG: ArgE/DapE family deacylase [Candidatus Methanospirare jalkutatii]